MDAREWLFTDEGHVWQNQHLDLHISATTMHGSLFDTCGMFGLKSQENSAAQWHWHETKPRPTAYQKWPDYDSTPPERV